MNATWQREWTPRLRTNWTMGFIARKATTRCHAMRAPITPMGMASCPHYDAATLRRLMKASILETITGGHRRMRPSQSMFR